MGEGIKAGEERTKSSLCMGGGDGNQT